MIKIAFIIDTIGSPTAGTEKQLLLLLNNLNREMFQPYLCVLKSSDWLESRFNACPVHVLGITSFKDFKSYLHIYKFAGFLKEKKIDIIQTHFRDAGIAGILAAKLAGTGTVISTRRNQGYWLNNRELALQKFLNRWVDVFIANSNSTKKWMSDIERVSEEKAQVIYNGIDIDAFDKSNPGTRLKSREMLGINGNAPAIGIVANLRPVKGVDIFLRAAAIVRNEIPSAAFFVVGDGSEKDNLKKLRHELELDGEVRFLGKREDIPFLLTALDLGVLSSHSESFSNAVVEYLAAGLPVVCTDVGGCREAVEHGVNGFIVPTGDYGKMASRIIEIIKKGLVSGMSLKSRQMAENYFSISKTGKAYEGVYINLTGFAKAAAERI